MNHTEPVFLAARRRVHRKRRVVPARAASAGPVLVSAAYDAGNDPPILTLTFDRGVDVSGLDGNEILVNDDSFTGLKYFATGGVSQPDATTVELLLTGDGFPGAAGLWVTAGAGNGIVGAEGEEAWAGVTELALPFP